MENYTICNCKQVTYFDVEDALKDNKTFSDVEKTFEEVQKATHCSTGCGGCYSKILDAISEIISLKRSGREIIGCVEDDGIGIEPEHLPYIWERFYRADASRTGRQGENHSGLGLSMVKWIAQAHGGSVKAESRPAEGSRFTFTIPADDEEAELENRI